MTDGEPINQGKHPIVIFDGVCNLCENSVSFVIKHDSHARFRFVSAQSDLGGELQKKHGVDAIKEETIILIKEGKALIKSDAVLEIAKDLDGLWKCLAIAKIVPRPIRHWVYSWISKNRYRWFGKKSQCMVPSPDIMQRFL